jgi:hypothetical protein
MKSKEVSALEVLRAFYIGDELLGELFQKKHTGGHAEKFLKNILKKAKRIPKETLLTHALGNHHPRYDNYLNSSWTLKEIRLKDCGAWPRMGGLPDAATRGNILETAEYLRPFLEDKQRLTLATGRVLYLEEMMQHVRDIAKHVPIIVLEEGVIRHNKLIKPAMKKLYARCKYDIDDGNHRALALALLGETKMKALVGKRIYKNSLLYD